MRLCEAIEEIDRKEAGSYQPEEEEEIFKDSLSNIKMKQVMTITQAMEAPVKKYALTESIGQISAEFVYLYPPGIPLLVPGELITGQFVRNVRRYMEKGLNIQGLSDYSNETIYAAVR